MSLPTNLTTNEVKDQSGTENEYIRKSSGEGFVQYQLNGAAPNRPYTLKVSHSESGTGTNKRRRSLVRFDHTVIGYSSLAPKVVSGYVVLDIPVGDIEDLVPASKIAANIMSFLASQGASTTILYDGTGYGAAALINGTL